MDLELPNLCELVGVPYQPDVLEGISRDINARHYHVPDEPWVVEWSDIKKLDQIIYENVKDLAIKYGYEEQD